MSDQRAAFWAGGGASEGRLGPWSTLRLGGKIFPGVDTVDNPGACPVRVLRGGVGYRIDAQRVKGKSGHKLNVEAYEPTKFTAEVMIYTPAQWAAFRAYFPTINPKLKTNFRKAYASQHPVLDTYGISSVYVRYVPFPEDGDNRMIKVIPMELWEVFGIRTGGKDETKAVKADEIPSAIPEARGIGGPQPSGTVYTEPRRP